MIIVMVRYNMWWVGLKKHLTRSMHTPAPLYILVSRINKHIHWLDIRTQDKALGFCSSRRSLSLFLFLLFWNFHRMWAIDAMKSNINRSLVGFYNHQARWISKYSGSYSLSIFIFNFNFCFRFLITEGPMVGALCKSVRSYPSLPSKIELKVDRRAKYFVIWLGLFLRSNFHTHHNI